MKNLLHIIHVEDSEEDSELVKRQLENEGVQCEIKRIETRAALVDHLCGTEYDLVLSDCTLPQFSGFDALEISLALKPQIPFIFFSGTIGEEAAIESLRNGATDYVLKNNLSRLVPAVRRALTETEEQATRREIERRLHQTRRLQGVTTLAANVAHDVDQILATIRGCASSLATEFSNSPRALELISVLEKNANQGSEQMHQLLSFARRHKASLTDVELIPFLGRLASEMKLTLPRDIELMFKLEPKLPHIFADPEQLRRILSNIILNARDALPVGGRITISTELVHFDPIPPHAAVVEDTPYLALRIADNGIGMDEATRLRIFEPFFTTKSIGKGSGLGLSEVFGLMRIHNGLIEVQSAPGKGTTVSLYFPLPRNSKIAPESITQIPPVSMPEVAAPL